MFFIINTINIFNYNNEDDRSVTCRYALGNLKYVRSLAIKEPVGNLSLVKNMIAQQII